jgi:hypothetical protein
VVWINKFVEQSADYIFGTLLGERLPVLDFLAIRLIASQAGLLARF